MLTRVRAGGLSLVGVSVGGVYTSLSVPELGVIFDVGVAPRSFVGPNFLLISHGHADHIGALISLLGVRGLNRVAPPRIFVPREIECDVRDGIAAFNRAQRRASEPEIVPVEPGEEFSLDADLRVRVFRTLHTVPSVGYELFRKVRKLKPEFLRLPPHAIRELKRDQADLFMDVDRSQVAYATDTLVDVLDQNPRLYDSRVLVLECTFLDERKGRSEARDKCHIHLDDILDRADLFKNEHLVLMHFSQLYQPAEVREILKRRCPEALHRRVVAFAPEQGTWPG